MATSRAILRRPEFTRRLEVHIAVLIFALVFPTLGTWLYFHTFAGTQWMQPVYLGFKILQFALPVVWAAFVTPRAIGLPRLEPKSLLPVVLFGAVVAVGMVAGYFALFRGTEMLAAAPAELSAKLDAAGITTPARFLGLAVFYSLAHSLLEEYYWRWFVFGQLRRIVGIVTAMLISSIGFMAHHVVLVASYMNSWGTTILFSLAVAVGGIVWAWFYHRSRSIVGPWLSHLLVDAGLMILGFDLAFRLAG